MPTLRETIFTVHPQAQRFAIVIACNVNPFSDRQGIIARDPKAAQSDFGLPPTIEAKEKAIFGKVNRPGFTGG